MKKYLFTIGLFITVLLNMFTSCNEKDVFQLTTSDEPNQNVTNTLSTSTRYRKGSSINLYQVSKEDVINLSKSLRPQKDYKMNVYQISNDTLLYLLDYGDEWIIIAGDKRINPIVALSKDDELSFDSPNESLKTWIDSYADEILAIRDDIREIENENTKFWTMVSQSKPKNKAKTRNPEYKWAVVTYIYSDSEMSSDVVSHLVSTKWGQNLPWNNNYPIDTNNNNKKCKAGCAAVAFAQMAYYMHYHLSKPTGLYHNISVSSSIAGPTTNIGFSRSDYNSNSTRWNTMALSGTSSSTGNQYDYVGDLMLDIGNRMQLSYSGNGTGGDISISGVSNYNLTYSYSNYNYQTVKTDLNNSKPVYVTAACDDPLTNERVGHAWLIDGYGITTTHYVIQKTFEYTENWMYASEYYDTFDELRAHYHINSEYDVVLEDGGYVYTEYLRMNWGENGNNDGGYYSTYPSSIWKFIGDLSLNYDYRYDKKIKYDFR